MITLAVKHARTVLAIFALLLITGIFSYISIPKESNPDISIPIVYISVHHEGISPEDAVDQILKPLEVEMRGLDGLDELEGTAYESGANLVVHFQAGFDIDQALLDVREAVDRAKPELPEDADEPRVSEVNFSLFPILTVILNGDIPQRELKRIVEDLQDRVQSISGVLEANIGGVQEEQLLIEVNKAKMQSYNLSGSELISAIQANNQLVAAGSLELEEGSYPIKIPGLFKSPQDLLNLPILSDGTRTVRIRDIGTVKPTFKDPTSITRVNGKPAVTLEIRKRIGENIIETVDHVKQVVETESATWPANLSYSFANDESRGVRQQLSDLQNNVLVAVILVMIVILAAMGMRNAFLVALTVPGSFLTSIMLLFFLGFTTNVVVLFALILAVGMLVDGAVVVTELADVKLNEGMKRREAFIYAAQYMAWPIIASTATTLAAFMPLLFWPDIVGEFMKFMPLTLIFTLSASLAMALIFLPTIGALLPRPPVAHNTQKTVHPAIRTFEHILSSALNHPVKILSATVVVFIGVIFAYGAFGKGVEFFPSIEPEKAQLVINAQGDLSIYEKDAIVKQVEDRILDLDGVKTFYVTVGESIGNSGGPSHAIGVINMEYIPWEEGRPRSETILTKALERTKDIYGITVQRQEEEAGPGGGKPIQLVVTGDNFNQVSAVAKQIRSRLEQEDGLINVDDNLPEPGIEWALNVDRAEAERLGTNLSSIGQILRLSTNGAIVGTYRPARADEEIDIVARFNKSERTLTTIDDLTIINKFGKRIPLSHFVTRAPQPKVTTINRLDQKNSATVDADVAKGVLADDVVHVIRAELAENNFPQGIRVEFKGEDEDQKKSGAFLQRAFMVALFIMAIILVTQFNNYYQAGVILSAVIFSTAGVLLGHIIMGKPFGIVMSGLGIIALAGIVVNNNIVLIDTFNKLRAEGTNDWKSIIMTTTLSRLRPVLLTAFTTIVGLLPLAFRLNINLMERSVAYNAPSTQWWDQLASSIVFGLAFSTILTLVITPCMLAIWYRKR